MNFIKKSLNFCQKILWLAVWMTFSLVSMRSVANADQACDAVMAKYKLADEAYAPFDLKKQETEKEYEKSNTDYEALNKSMQELCAEDPSDSKCAQAYQAAEQSFNAADGAYQEYEKAYQAASLAHEKYLKAYAEADIEFEKVCTENSNTVESKSKEPSR